MSVYPLASSTWDGREIAAIQRVIASGHYSMGEEVARFETDFARWVGARYAVMVNSGSSANLAIISALTFMRNARLRPGDEVIVPAVSWSTTYAPLQQHGLHLRFVDIDRETLNLDITQVAAALTERTRAIFAVNLLGNPVDYAKLQDVVRGRDIIILEDNCESMGAMLADKQAGTFGLMGSFSCFFSHHISTMEGGLVVTDDEELYHILLCIRAHGWTRNLPTNNLVCGVKSDDPFEESFRFVLPGYNLRPLEMSGAIGCEQLQKLPSMIATRRANAVAFQDLFRDHPWIDIQQETGSSSWFGFSLVLREDAPISRKDAVARLRESGIDVRPIVAGNFAKNEVMKWFDYSVAGDLRNADYIDKHGFFVGNHHYSLDEQLQHLRRTLS